MIGIIYPDGAGQDIYCHNDGYPDCPGVGYILLSHYTEPNQVRELMQNGHLSVLGENPGHSDSRRDRGEPENRCAAENFYRQRRNILSHRLAAKAKIQPLALLLYSCPRLARGAGEHPKETPGDRIISRIRPLTEWVAQGNRQRLAASAN